VSIKPFPYYIHLLQENYVEYKHILTFICLRRSYIPYDLGHRTSDVTPGPLTVTDTSIMFYLTNFNASRNVILHMRYVSTCVGARVVGGR
jgi:hypothetical protein